MTIFHTLGIFISVSWHILRKVEELIRIPMDIRLGCRGETENKSVEVIEDALEFAIDATVGLIRYYEIEMARSKYQFILVIPGFVNDIAHSLVCAEYDLRRIIVIIQTEVGSFDIILEHQPEPAVRL